jgi:hypothetical protein
MLLLGYFAFDEPHMNSGSRDGMRDQFSNRPTLHYFLAISITSIVAAFILSFRTFDCLNSGNTYDCEYEPGSPAMTVFAVGAPDLFRTLSTTALISIVWGLILCVALLVTNIPIYALTHYASRRYRVRRNVLGCAFWIAAWTLALLTGLILGEIRDLFDAGHVSWWSADLFFVLEFGIAGLFCGIAYCALAFLQSGQT